MTRATDIFLVYELMSRITNILSGLSNSGVQMSGIQVNHGLVYWAFIRYTQQQERQNGNFRN